MDLNTFSESMTKFKLLKTYYCKSNKFVDKI